MHPRGVPSRSFTLCSSVLEGLMLVCWFAGTACAFRHDPMRRTGPRALAAEGGDSGQRVARGRGGVRGRREGGVVRQDPRPSLSESPSSDEEDQGDTLQAGTPAPRVIPGFYYDAEKDAYFALPKDGCVVAAAAAQACLEATQKRSQAKRKRRQMLRREGRGKAVGAERPEGPGPVGRQVTVSLSAWRGGGGCERVVEARTVATSVYAALQRREVVGGSVRPLGGHLLGGITSGLKAVPWHSHQGQHRRLPLAPAEQVTGVALAVCRGLLVTAGRCGAMVLAPEHPAAASGCAGGGSCSGEPAYTPWWVGGPRDVGFGETSRVSSASVRNLMGSASEVMLAVASQGGSVRGHEGGVSFRKLSLGPGLPGLLEQEAAPGGRALWSCHQAKAGVGVCQWDGRGLVLAAAAGASVLALDAGVYSRPCDADVFRCRHSHSDVLSLLFLPQGAGAAQHAAGAEQLVAVGRRDGTVSFLDRRVPGGWLRAVGGAGAGGEGWASEGSSLKCPSSVCGMAALQGGGASQYADLILSFPRPSSDGRGGGLWRVDLRKPATPVLVYRGHVNSHRLAVPAVSAGGRVLWCGGSDGCVRAWMAASGRMLYESERLSACNKVPALSRECLMRVKMRPCPSLPALWCTPLATRLGASTLLVCIKDGHDSSQIKMPVTDNRVPTASSCISGVCGLLAPRLPRLPRRISCALATHRRHVAGQHERSRRLRGDWRGRAIGVAAVGID